METGTTPESHGLDLIPVSEAARIAAVDPGTIRRRFARTKAGALQKYYILENGARKQAVDRRELEEVFPVACRPEFKSHQDSPPDDSRLEQLPSPVWRHPLVVTQSVLCVVMLCSLGIQYLYSSNEYNVSELKRLESENLLDHVSQELGEAKSALTTAEHQLATTQSSIMLARELRNELLDAITKHDSVIEHVMTLLRDAQDDLTESLPHASAELAPSIKEVRQTLADSAAALNSAHLKLAGIGRDARQEWKRAFWEDAKRMHGDGVADGPPVLVPGWVQVSSISVVGTDSDDNALLVGLITDSYPRPFDSFCSTDFESAIGNAIKHLDHGGLLGPKD